MAFEWSGSKHGSAGRQVLSALEEQRKKKRKAASLASLFCERGAAGAKQRPRSIGAEAPCLLHSVGASADGAGSLFAFNFTTLSN